MIDRPDGTWVQAATRVGRDGDEAAAEAELEERLASFEVEPLATPTDAVLGRSTDRSRADRRAVGADTDTDDDYLAHVASAVAAIERGEMQKVVLARTVALDIELDAVAVLDLLRRRNPTCAVFAFTNGDSTFLGATPEELVTLNGPWLHTTALAGTAPRGDTPTPTNGSPPSCWRRPRTGPSTGSSWTASLKRSQSWDSSTRHRRSPVCCSSAASNTCALPSPRGCSADAAA